MQLSYKLPHSKDHLHPLVASQIGMPKFSSAMSPTFAVWVLLLAALAMSACRGTQQQRTEQRRDISQRPVLPKNNFDYYVLALSWAPAFCAHQTERSYFRECDPRRSVGFVIHGLWPQNDTGRPLEYCKEVHPLSHDIVDDTLGIMPDRSLIQHEWRAHGSCSGLSSREYFATVRRAAAKVKIPERFAPRSRRIRISPAQIEQELQSDSGFTVPATRVACRNGELTEIRVCFSKSLDPVPCGPSLPECREPRVFLRTLP